MSDIKIILDANNELDSKEEITALAYALVETCIDHLIPVISVELDNEILFKK